MTRVDKIIKWFNDEEYTLDQCVEWFDDHKNQYNDEETFEILMRLQNIFGTFIGRKQ